MGEQPPHGEASLMICPDCEPTSSRGGGVAGVTEARDLMGRLINLILLAGEAASKDGPAHPWLQEIGIFRVPKEFVELTTGLAGRAPSIFGHDAMDGYEAQKKILRAAGLSESWGLCPTCGGSTEIPDDA